MTCEGCGADVALVEECDYCDRELCPDCRRASVDNDGVLARVCVPCALDERCDEVQLHPTRESRVTIPPGQRESATTDTAA